MREAEHVNGEAELYALGVLGELEAARLERHVRSCDDCARRVGEAEETALRLIECGVRERATVLPSRRLLAGARTRTVEAVAAAAACAAVVTFVVTAYLLPIGPHARSSVERPALAAMLAGHFLHAPLVASAPGAPAAKVVYAREGGWLYVIAAPGKDALDIVVDRRSPPAASLAPSDAVRSRFVSIAGRVKTVELVDRGATIAAAHLVYPRR